MTKRKPPMPPGPVLRREAAMGYCGLSFTAFDEAVRRGDLPQPIRISDSNRVLVWLKAELDAWLDVRRAKRDEALAARQEEQQSGAHKNKRATAR